MFVCLPILASFLNQIVCLYTLYIPLLYLVLCSSFDIHWGHKLTKAEVENLSKKKWTYEWEVPAVGMTKGNWAGTGECFTKVCYPFMTCTIFILCLFVKALEMISFALVLSIEALSRVKATESTFVLPYLSFLLFNSGSNDRSCSLHTLEEPPLRANHTYSYWQTIWSKSPQA